MDHDSVVTTTGSKQFTGVGTVIRKRCTVWVIARADLSCEITQKGDITALRFRRPLRGTMGRGKASPPLTPMQQSEIRSFVSTLAQEFGLQTNTCVMTCVGGHSWFVVTLT
jgi:hypothetical protein